MLIRSQDKGQLINMDAVFELAEVIDYADNTPVQWNIVAVRSASGSDQIGSYSSDEKVLAVLDEIAYNYERNKDTEYLGADGPHIRSSIFQMPADDDPWFDMRNPDQLIDKGTAKHCLAVVEKYIQQNKNAHVATICCGDRQVGLELEEYEHE